MFCRVFAPSNLRAHHWRLRCIRRVERLLSISTTRSRIIAPLNLATDLLDDKALRIGSVLRMAEHHLNLRSQGLIPHPRVEPFCVSQACATIALDNLKAELESKIQQCNVNGSDMGFIPLFSEVWVQSLGKSSISFGHAISFGTQTLGLATRVYVRLDASTGKLMDVTEEERSGVLEPSPHPSLTLPEVEKLDEPTNDAKEIFQVKIGPQHCNNIHVDHAALADLVLQGLSIQGHSLVAKKLAMQYVNPGKLGRIVSCRSQPDHAHAAIYQQDGSKEILLAIGHLS